MNLAYAVDRLLEVGWSASYGMDIEHLPDRRGFSINPGSARGIFPGRFGTFD